MKQLLSISFLLSLIVITSCSYNRSPGSGNYDPNDPGFEVAPDMYHSVPYEGLSQKVEADNPYNEHGMNMKKPVDGTIPRGKLAYAYPYPNTTEGYIQAGEELSNPLPETEENMAEAERLYMSYCSHCHGSKGNSGGPVMASGKFPKPHFGQFTSDYIKTLPDGRKYHTIVWGKNLMGSHASQLSPKERWLVINYVNKLSKGE